MPGYLICLWSQRKADAGRNGSPSCLIAADRAQMLMPCGFLRASPLAIMPWTVWSAGMHPDPHAHHAADQELQDS